ncbi:TetR/AcrR family transcriptional regulator [Rhizobium laguerreae]|uniref:TetR/AcrR family transcriptional regulator n=1 Tax=Rhizobium laguerreae TaxID=1076926 RepID=UPI001C914A03|nr:TetR/AcrR family transcriptional regulator [Rhizobium laguerreae]MBY3195171.1 TetR/AcrR family transcriptional regulator [Rhizobium laguerreae]
MTTKTVRRRGRPRRFDPEEGVAVAQRLFLAQGYDAVGVADLTEALGINPPSFYAAYGSKAELFKRALNRYSETGGVPLMAILQPGRPVAEALSEVLKDAAEKYTANNGSGGCLAIEGTKCNDMDARSAALTLTSAARSTICRFIAATHPDVAESTADYMVAVMSGLSAVAREGYGSHRVIQIAELAATALIGKLTDQQGENY